MKISNLAKIITGVFLMSSCAFSSILPKYESETLANGMQIVVIPIKNHSNVIQTSVFYKVGSRNETMGKSGIAHMLEHLSFKSTKNLKAGEFDSIVKKMGGVDNASTSFDYTQYFIKSHAKHVGKSIELLSELMSNLSLKDDEFQPERNVVMQERLWRTDNSPTGYLFFRFFNSAFLYHPYHWTPIGFIDDIKNWSIEDIRKFHSIYYQPKNAILLVSGDIDPKVVFDLAKKYFGVIKNANENIPPVFTKEPKQDGSRVVHLKKDTGGVELVAIGFRTSDYKQKDQIALDALSDILGNGKSSILDSLLVDKLKLASSVEVFNMGLKDDGVFFIIAQANNGVKAQILKDAIQKEIEKIKKGKFSDQDLEKVKINAKYDFVSSLGDSSSVSSLFGPYFAMGDISPLINYESNLAKLTTKDLQEVANKYFIDDNSTTLFMSK